MTWRSIPITQYKIDHPKDSDISDIFKKMILSLNLALFKTFKGIKYKKFAILYSINYGTTQSTFQIICHEVEFVTSFQNFVENRYTKEDVSSTIEAMVDKISKGISIMPLGDHIAATIVYDEQAREITLGEEPLHMDMTTSWLLFQLASMSKAKVIFDPNGLIIDNYNLRKFIVHNIDSGIELSRIKINSDNYEEWDYYNPEYDREVEIYSKTVEDKVQELCEFEPKEIELPKNKSEFLEIVDELLFDFKNMVEIEGYKLLLDDNKNPRHEEHCQILFNIFLKKYCQSRGIDLTREVQTGRGPIDFRFSSTVNFIAHVELKKENNSKLTHGLCTQLPTYMEAENVKLGFFVIFDFGQKDISKLKERFEKERIELERDNDVILRIVYIDAKQKPSASHV